MKKRFIKNVIVIILMIILGVLSYFTMRNAKSTLVKTSSGANDDIMMMDEKSQGGIPGEMGTGEQGDTPPDMPSGSAETGEQGGTPPEKPSGDGETGEQGDTPPEMPSENNETGEQSNTPPEMPEGNSGNGMQGSQPMDMNNRENMSEENTQEEPELTTVYYVLFGCEAGLFSILLMYLIMSGFNKKSLRETLLNKKIIVYVVFVLILTAILTWGEVEIVNKVFLATDSSNSNQTQVSEQGMQPEMSSSQNSQISYSAVEEITEDTELTEGTFESENKDENAILVSGDIDVTLSGIKVNKTGDSDGGDNSNFYGNNSGIIAKDGANLTLKDIVVNTDATGANGVFSYGGSATTNNSSSDGTTVTISDSEITTSGDNAGGIMTTGGGIMNASNLTINTSGTSSAAIRTDRGGGTVKVSGGTYTTTGQGSPAIYSTADITVEDADLIAKASEGIVIEGKNSVTISNCNLTDSNTKLNGQSTTYKNIFLYQSMSGDAADGNAEFTAKDSKIVTNNGDTFYVTNTTATINLENNSIVNNDNSGNFLRVQKDSWGNTGANGGDVTLNMINQSAIGNIVIDAISTLEMNLKTDSYFEGIINGDNSAQNIKLVLDETSRIKLMGDSYVSELEDEDNDYSNIDFNGYKLYVNGTAIN